MKRMPSLFHGPIQINGNIYKIPTHIVYVGDDVEEMATVNIDERGRILLPRWARIRLKGRKAVVHKGKEGQIIIEPAMSVDEAFGSLPDIDIEGFRKEHAKER